MHRLTSGVGTRVRVAALMLALLGSLIPTASVLAAGVNPATGGSAISADQFGTSNFTTISGPAIQEAAAGELVAGSTIILNVPAGFKFNPGIGNTSVGGGTCAGLSGTLVVTAATATFTVSTVSTSPCVLTFVGLQVQPTQGTLPNTGNITKSGTSAALANGTPMGTLTMVAGAVTQLTYDTQPSPNNPGGNPFGTQPKITARDQFGNAAANVPVTLAITPGTGAAGATLTCTTNPLNTDGAGAADFAAQGCRIDLAGTYRLRASNGAVFVDSGVFNVNVGPASKIIFKSYPNTTTPPLLNPQPRVAVTDAGGNTVTTFPSQNITIAINKAGGTFSCTGGLSQPTVNGEATFTGCTQTTSDTGYALSAAIGVFNIVGPAFAVTSATLAFTAGPGSPVLTGQAFPTNIQVAIQNGGTTITSGVSATVTLGIGTNAGGGVLTCTGGNAVGTINGVATFTGCSISAAGSGYTLTATASNIVPAQTIGSATSAPFNVGTAISAAVLSITSSCSPGCPPDTTKSPPQADIKLPQNLSEGVTLVAQFASNGANRSVVFEVSKDQTTWSTVATVTSDASGRATTFYRPSDNRYYRARFAGAGDLGAGTSPTLRIVVRSLIFLRPTGCTASSPCRRSDGTTITFTATARPNRPELPQQQVQFVVFRKSGSTFVEVLTQVVNVNKSTGTASLNINFSAEGSYRLRANLLPTSVNANSFPTEFEHYTIT